MVSGSWRRIALVAALLAAFSIAWPAAARARAEAPRAASAGWLAPVWAAGLEAWFPGLGLPRWLSAVAARWQAGGSGAQHPAFHGATAAAADTASGAGGSTGSSGSAGSGGTGTGTVGGSASVVVDPNG
jgi:hypothetical protein